MPELPDLEVFAENLTRQLKGKRIASVKAPVAKAVDRSATTVQKMLKGKALSKVERSGKELLFHFQGGVSFLVHLMLHGRFVLAEKKEAVKFSLVELVFEGGQKLVVSDFLKKAKIRVDIPAEEAPDALSPAVNAAFLRSLLKGRSTAVKKVLTDQKKIRGIGSAYADEMLWAAGISPYSAAGAIPADKVAALARSLKKELRDAVKAIRKSHPDIIQGEVRDHMKVHSADKTEDPKGHPILKKKEGGRTTYYTKRQTLYE